jgi:hypothetical protein
MPLNDAVELFVKTATNLEKGLINLNFPLEEIVIKQCGKDLAYIDNRRDAKEKYGFDLWKDYTLESLKKHGIEKRLLYSESQQFPDFLFRVKKKARMFEGGSLMELKDSKGSSISSFNSTIPTKSKTLEEIDVINGNNLVSKIASFIDREFALDENYFKFERKCFYLVRTHKGNEKVKVSIIDGAFFETVPKEHLFYQMLLNVYQRHLEKKNIKIAKETLEQVKEALAYINDQTIIASSQIIEKASIRPRLRIMAEVHPEGNPHSNTHYPEIKEGSFNLIIQSTAETKQFKEKILRSVSNTEVFSIFHKRNGEHIVFQYKKGKNLSQYLKPPS